MRIALPESLEPIVRQRVEEGGYDSAEEYVRALILADQEPNPEWQSLTDEERQEVARINKMLLMSLDSGPPLEADEAYWEAKRQRLRQRRAHGGASDRPS